MPRQGSRFVASFLLCIATLLFAGCSQGETATPTRAEQAGVTPDGRSTEAPVPVDPAMLPSDLVRPTDVTYLGAFRLPEGSGGSNWEYSGYAMTYYPGGDSDGPDDGHPGSLFAVGHDHQQMVSEISIPAPKISPSKNAAELNTAETLQAFHDVRGGQFGELEIPRAGIEYLPPQGKQTSGKLHYCWGQHHQDQQDPSHGWCELDLSAPKPAGAWRVAHYPNYVTCDYLFEIPADWAAVHTPGLRLATGRFRDGGWSGLGPALLACGPWTEGNPPATGGTLKNVKSLLMYGVAVEGNPELQVDRTHALDGYRESDEWSGGAWLTVGDKSAVVFVGTKGVGNCWYGFSNGVAYPTDGNEHQTVPPVPDWPHDQRGWWSERIEAQILFFNPQDLADVVQGKTETWEPQPYATLSINQYLFDPGYDYERGKMNVLGAATFDRERGILYVMERQGDEEKSLVHVFGVR